jgi:hypothetical protein
MRKILLPAVAVAALAFVALDTTPAKAQVIVTNGHSPLAYSPYYYGGSGIVIGNGGVQIGTSPAYSDFGYPSYGYNPYYGGGYNSYYRTGYWSNYGGGYSYPRYSGGYRGGWRR